MTEKECVALQSEVRGEVSKRFHQFAFSCQNKNRVANLVMYSLSRLQKCSMVLYHVSHVCDYRYQLTIRNIRKAKAVKNFLTIQIRLRSQTLQIQAIVNCLHFFRVDAFRNQFGSYRIGVGHHRVSKHKGTVLDKFL